MRSFQFVPFSVIVKREIGPCSIDSQNSEDKRPAIKFISRGDGIRREFQLNKPESGEIGWKLSLLKKRRSLRHCIMWIFMTRQRCMSNIVSNWFFMLLFFFFRVSHSYSRDHNLSSPITQPSAPVASSIQNTTHPLPDVFPPTPGEYPQKPPNKHVSSPDTGFASPAAPTATCVGVEKFVRYSLVPQYQSLKCSSLPQKDCQGVPCTAPYTETPLDSPCGCVLPMQLSFQLDMTLDELFPLIPDLIMAIASGSVLLPSQVRVVGANIYNQDQSKSVALVDLVPLGKAFDNLTALMIFQKFWNHQALISDTYFGNYTPIYVHYPGIPVYGYPSDMTSTEIPGAGILPSEQPLSVDVMTHRGKKFTGSTMAVILVSSIIAGIAVIAVLVLLFLQLNGQVPTVRSTTTKNIHTYPHRTSEFISSSDIKSTVSDSFSSMAPCTVSAKTFCLRELERATDNFSPKNVVGEGGFGQVFCGILEDGSKVAVKVLTKDDRQRAKEFIAEVEMLSRLHHRNLVKLIGVCVAEQIYCLVYEFILNGSVESHLHGADKHVLSLDWDARMKIALGAARGLAYLHEDANPRVIHRDFKASNILLEEDFTPKISDFGLAKAAPDEEDGHVTTTVMGTFGYVAPEYAMTGHLLVKSDVYSYGVVLLELLSGRKPIDYSRPPGEENLVNWARPLLASRGGLDILADPVLKENLSFDHFSRVAAIASMCVQPEVSHRPFMGEVVQALKLVCNGVCSVGVSPEDGGAGGMDDRAAMSGPLNTVDSISPISVEYDSGTVHVLRREGEIYSASDDHSSIEKPLFDSFRRHSTSGPLSSTNANPDWSAEKDQIRISMSEHQKVRQFKRYVTDKNIIWL